MAPLPSVPKEAASTDAIHQTLSTTRTLEFQHKFRPAFQYNFYTNLICIIVYDGCMFNTCREHAQNKLIPVHLLIEGHTVEFQKKIAYLVSFSDTHPIGALSNWHEFSIVTRECFLFPGTSGTKNSN